MIFSFDIDGTLIEHNYLLFDSYREAIKKTYGKALTSTSRDLVGNTDFQNLKLLSIQVGVDAEEVEDTLPSLCRSFVRIYSSKFKTVKWNECSNAKHTVDYLLDNRNFKVGIHSGGLKTTSLKKLKIFNYDINKFDFLFFGDSKATRTEVIAGITKKIKASEDVFVIGDTPQDILSAKELGFKSIGVSSGHFDYEALNQIQPDLCVRNIKHIISELNL